ncbi:MAG: formate hydrogenlyase maturation protein HycH [Acidobacteriota bacterium]|jgi:hypothetical protein|nr:formate hydrogenlyase maturation protein HycH [Acidobacteriota bacterium]
MTGEEKTGLRDVVFYQLCVKFVDNEREIPDESSEVLYYSLQIGHHTGIIDCLSEKIRCPYGAFIEVVEALPHASVPRYKLEGILRHGEIQIDKTHLGSLYPAISDLLSKNPSPYSFSDEAKALLLGLSTALDAIREQPGVYLMGRLVVSG